ncbi:MAG: monovalent cation/H(+) antiporter subunit G [Chitinophagaceae bacterium]
MIEGLIMLLTGVGAIAILLAAVGILRMPDLYLRLSVTTKAATLGVGLILVGAAFYFQNVGVTSRVFAIILFITLTAPVSAQLIGRAAYLIKTKMWHRTITDELEGMYESSTETLHSENITGTEHNLKGKTDA